MALIGCSHLRQLPDQIRKLDALAQQQPRATIVADLSIVGRHELLREIADRGFVAAALPIYGVAERSSSRLDPQRVLDIAIMQMESGAGLLTIHPTPTRELVELSRRRLVSWTSRGGGLVIDDLLAHDASENVYLRILPELISHARRTKTVLSIGASFRSANIFDSFDAAQQKEIASQIELAESVRRANVGAMIESPGHARPRDILRVAQILGSCGFPIMPLGPIPTDVATGRDHISAAIGAVLLGIHGAAHVLAAVTREEHTGGVPTIHSTLEAVEAALVAAHIIDIETLNETAEDLETATTRAKTATCVLEKSTEGCSRCATTCPLVGAHRFRVALD
jgi:phosphomethylpyrimidine synthase